METCERDCPVCSIGHLEVFLKANSERPVLMCLCCNTELKNVIPLVVPKAVWDQRGPVWVC